MRWLLAGLLFALAVAMAIGTAAIRADNVRLRHEVERQYRAVEDRTIEYRRLLVARMADASPERLARLQWQMLKAEVERAQEQLQ
jgi:cell division protein FtsL